MSTRTAMAAATSALHRWSPSSGTGPDVLELIGSAKSLDSLCSALAGLESAMSSCTLAIARVSLPSSADLLAAMAAAHDMNLPVRVCLAIDSGLLRKIDAPMRNVDRIGILLDHVDATNSLAELAHEALEAVRFDPGFARHAAIHVRSQCALDAMLGLAQDLGLCTFGPMRRDDAWGSACKQFDYVAGGSTSLMA